MVDSVEDAIDHINRYGSGHSEAIVTRDTEAARRSSSASTPPACTSTRRPGSPTEASSGWGGDRQLDPEAPRARADRTARAVHVQVPVEGSATSARDAPSQSDSRAVRIGILGGTFNPPHLGHLVCAQEAYLQLGLDRVMLIPARMPPHKPVEDEPGPEHRLELCRLAVDGDEPLRVSELEIERDGAVVHGRYASSTALSERRIASCS